MQDVEDFFRVLSLCHTVLPQEENGIYHTDFTTCVMFFNAGYRCSGVQCAVTR